MSATANIAVGDEVSFVNDVGGGVVLVMLSHNRAKVRNSDGFEMEYALKELVKRTLKGSYRVSDHHAKLVAANDRMDDRIQRDKGKGASASNGGKAPKRVDDPSVMEVDLHLEKLIDNEAGLSDSEKLRFQLDYFERMLNTAIRERKRRLIVIHGVGEGVLREEVRKTLQYYEGCRFDDADPRRYGYGATAIDIVHY